MRVQVADPGNPRRGGEGGNSPAGGVALLIFLVIMLDPKLETARPRAVGWRRQHSQRLLEMWTALTGTRACRLQSRRAGCKADVPAPWQACRLQTLHN